MDSADIVDKDKKRLDWFDPRQVVAEAVHTANVLNEPDVDVTFTMGRMEKVRGALSPIRTALGQLLIIGVKRDRNVGGYVLHADLKGSKLIATLKAKDSVNQYLSHGHHLDVMADTVTSMGLGYCNVVAERNGGALAVEGSGFEADSSITLSFPVEKIHRTGKDSSERTKSGKGRKTL
jgi:hypothetical protein